MLIPNSTTASLQDLDLMHGLLLAFTSERARLHVCPRFLLPDVVSTG